MNKFVFFLLFFFLAITVLYAQEDSVQIKPGRSVLIQKGLIGQPDFSLSGGKSLLIHDLYVLPTAGYLPRKDKWTTFRNSPFTPFIIPTAFISYGVMAHFNSSLRKLDKDTHVEVSEHVNRRWRFDDFTQLMSATGVYGLELLGVKPKHTFRDRTFVMATAHLFMAGMVLGGKNLSGVERPNGQDRMSFPSGHTATAFTGAQILFREYKDVSPWIAVGGYAAAGLTGGMRVVNRKHWVSDVVAGAGVGILSAEVAYLLLPVFQRTCRNWQGNKQLVITPVAGLEQYGVGLAYTF